VALLTIYAVSRLPISAKARMATAAVLLLFSLAQALELSWNLGVLPRSVVRSRLQALWANDACRGSKAADCLFNVYPALPTDTNDQQMALAAAAAYFRQNRGADQCRMFYPPGSSLRDFAPHAYFVKMLEGTLDRAFFPDVAEADENLRRELAEKGCAYLLTASAAPPEGAAAAGLESRLAIETVWHDVSTPRGDSLFLFRLAVSPPDSPR